MEGRLAFNYFDQPEVLSEVWPLTSDLAAESSCFVSGMRISLGFLHLAGVSKPGDLEFLRPCRESNMR